jgi:hypothetical protein
MNQFVWFSPYGLNSAQYIDLSSSWIAIRPCSEHEMSPYKFLQLKFFVVKTVNTK